MKSHGRVLLITGPAGSGKSTLAERVSTGLDWQLMSEDTYWVRNGWDHGIRTVEQEKAVQDQVFDDLLSKARLGNVVLEFILYKTPPNPLTAYQRMLTGSSIGFDTIALKPSVDEIMKRLVSRGRPSDLDNLEARRKDAENQLHCLQPEFLASAMIIDCTDTSIDELYERCITVIGN